MDVSWEDYGSYATDIFTNEATKAINGHNQSQPLFLYLAHLAVHSANTYMPLQAPAEIVDLFDNIQDENRRCVWKVDVIFRCADVVLFNFRIFAGMLYKLDESVGKVVSALKQNGNFIVKIHDKNSTINRKSLYLFRYARKFSDCFHYG